MKRLNASISHSKLNQQCPVALLLTCLCLFISGCSQSPVVEQLDQPDWKISGKIGVRQSLMKGGSATFSWSQQNEHYIIHLFNSLGQPLLTLKGNDQQALAQQADGKIYSAKTPEQLMQKITGWSFPVAPVKQWLQGRTYGSETNIQYNDDNQLKSFNTERWQATLDKYQPVGNQDYPHRLKLVKPELKLTIIIKKHDPRFL